MKKQMIILALTLLICSTKIGGSATSVQAAEMLDLTIDNSAEQISEVAEHTMERNIMVAYYEVVVDKASIKNGASSSSKTVATAYKGQRYKKFGEDGNWIKISYGAGYGYINKSALKKI